MFKKNYLTKEYMYRKYSSYNKEEILNNKDSFIRFLSDIEGEFYNFDFNVDNRYVCIGRHRFLIDEMEQLYYTKEYCKELGLTICPTKWCLDSLIEIIINSNNLSLEDYSKLSNTNSIYLNKTANDCRTIYDSYSKDGIISLNERDYILHALNMIRDSLKKCNDNMEWN